MDQTKKARTYALIATVLWLGIIILNLIDVSLKAKLEEKSFGEYIKPSTIYVLLVLLAISIAVLLQKKIVVAATASLYSLIWFYGFIGLRETVESSTYYYVRAWKFEPFSFLQCVSFFLLVLLIVLAVFKRKLPTLVWLIPAGCWIVAAIHWMADMISTNKKYWEPISHQIVAVLSVIWIVTSAMLIIMGFWLKNNTLAANASPKTDEDADNAEPAHDKKATLMTLAGCALMYAALIFAMIIYFNTVGDPSKADAYSFVKNEAVVPFNTFFFKNFFTSRSSYGYLLCGGIALTIFGLMQKKTPECVNGDGSV